VVLLLGGDGFYFRGRASAVCKVENFVGNCLPS